MKKQLLKWVLLLGGLVSGGWAAAQSGVKYPYVTTDSKGVANTIVCRDYKGGIKVNFLLTVEDRLRYMGGIDRPAYRITEGHAFKAAPKFRVAATYSSDKPSPSDLNSCYLYKEDPSDVEGTWRFPTYLEAQFIGLLYKKLGVFEPEFGTGSIIYVLMVMNSSGRYYAFSASGFGEVGYVQSLVGSDKAKLYFRCVRDVD